MKAQRYATKEAAQSANCGAYQVAWVGARYIQIDNLPAAGWYLFFRGLLGKVEYKQEVA